MKKILKTALAGALAVTTVLTSISPVSAVNEKQSLNLYRFFAAGDSKDAEMYSNGYWAKQGVSYTPEWKTADENAYLEPNYFRTSDGKVAYCLDPDKDAPSSVSANGDSISVKAYNIIKNGYPAKSGSTYGVSDAELEWATTVAVKAVSGNYFEKSDFGTELVPVSNADSAEKIKNVVFSLMDKANSSDEIDKFSLIADDAKVVLENDTYKVGPYSIDTNLSGDTYTELVGAPDSANIVKSGNNIYVTIPEEDVTKEMSFSLVAKNSAQMLSSDLYRPSSANEQSIYIYGMKDAVATADIKVTPEKRGVITINKKDETGKAIEGVEFTIYDEKNNEVGKMATDKTGKATSEKLPSGKYTVIETKAADGYILNQEKMVFNLVGDSVITEVDKTVINKKNTVEITKVAAGTSNGLNGAELEIASVDGSYKVTKTTDKDGKIVLKGLTAGEYTIKETKAPEGYKLSDDISKFKVDEFGKVTGTTKIENSLIKVDLKKVDSSTNKGLEGATIEVRDKDNNLVFVGETNSNGIVTVEKIPEGTYTATETKAPKGYQVNEKSITFTVDKYGNVTGDTTIKDDVTKVTIIKKDSATNQALAGAKIVIKDSKGNIVAQGTTDNNGIFEVTGLEPGVYVYYEDEAPEGYIKTNEKSTFTINSKGESLELTLYNTKFSLTSSSSDGTNGSSEIIKTGIEETAKNVVPVCLLITAIGISVFVVYKRKKALN